MKLIKTSLYTFFSTAVKLISGLFINKAVAHFVGPSGLALIGQFHNFSQLVMTAAQGAINNGVVKYTAEYGKDSNRLPKLFSTAFKISVACSLFTGALIIIFSRIASVEFLKTVEYAYVFVLFGITIIFFSLNGLLLSILNGLLEIKIFVTANIIQSISSLFFTTGLIVWFGLHGALIAMVTNQSITFFILLYLVRKHHLIAFGNFKERYDKTEAKKLFGYSVMVIVSATITPISNLIVRDHLTEKLGLAQAGYWQAMWYISQMYLLVVTTTLSVYYLPKLSAITDRSLLRKEIFIGFKLLFPIVLVSTASIYFLKDIVIRLLFTPDFAPIRQLFLFQLIGDVIKILAWLFSYLMLAKAMAKAYILTEIIFVSTFVILSTFLINRFGLVGATYAYAFNYFLYLICLIFIFWKSILKTNA
ncbi:MAG: O-antigen translocase [Segetibacter sp.]